jgi:hypothetical protein
MSRSQAQHQLPFDRRLDAEVWIASRIHDHTGSEKVSTLFEGVMEAEQRREAIRTAILENGLSQVWLGKRNGIGETYATFFSRMYGVKL